MIMKPQYLYAYKDVRAIEDKHLQLLFDEIATLNNISKTGWVLHFLQQAMQPLPPQKPSKLNKHELIPGCLLLKTFSQASATDIYRLCTGWYPSRRKDMLKTTAVSHCAASSTN